MIDSALKSISGMTTPSFDADCYTVYNKYISTIIGTIKHFLETYKPTVDQINNII